MTESLNTLATETSPEGKNVPSTPSGNLASPSSAPVKAVSEEKGCRSTDEMLQQFSKLYRMTLWSVYISIFFYAVAFFSMVILLVGGYSLFDKFANDQFKVYFGIFVVFISSLFLIYLIQHQPIRTQKRDIKGFIRLSIILFNYAKQMENISFLWKRLTLSESKKVMSDATQILSHMDQLTASMLSELDSDENLPE